MTETLDLSRCRVLLVDDVKSSLDVLVEALQGHHLLSIAVDGEGALRNIAHSPPSTIYAAIKSGRLRAASWRGLLVIATEDAHDYAAIKPLQRVEGGGGA